MHDYFNRLFQYRGWANRQTLASHGGYHRGQVAKAIGRAGGQAAVTDFIVYVCDPQRDNRSSAFFTAERLC
jgi:uncharacterized damage-inducible protein DinB